MKDAFSKQYERSVDNADYWSSQKQQLSETMSLLDQYYDKWAQIQEEISNITANSSGEDLSGNLYFQELIEESDKLNDEISLLEDKAQSLNMELHESASSMTLWDKLKISIQESRTSLEGFINTLRGVTSKIQTSFGGITQNIKGFVGKFGSFIPLIGRSKKDIGDMATSSICMFKKMGLALLGVRSVFMAVRKVFSEVKSQNEDIKLQIDSIWKGIATAITPVVKAVMNYVGILMGYINAIYKSFTGKDLFKASAKSSKETAKNTKEIKNQLASFDEMNVLSDNSKSDSSDNSTYKAPVTPDMTSFADQIKKAIEAEDWKAVGQIIGNKINEAVESVDYDKVGRTIGKGLNGSIQVAYFTLDTIDWERIGIHIAELLNGAMDEIDFSYLGRLLTKWGLIIPEILIGIINKLDFKLVAQSFSDYLIGVFDEVAKFLQKTDWSKLATSLYKGFKDLITGIKYSELASSFFTMLGSALGACASFIGTLAKNVGKDISDALTKVFKNSDGTMKSGREIVNGIFTGILDAIKGIGKWIQNNIFKPFIDGFKKAFDIHSPSKKMATIGGYIIDGLLSPFTNIWNKITKLGGEFFKNPSKFFKEKIVDKIKAQWDKLSSILKKPFESIANTIKQTFGGAINIVIRFVNKMIEELNKLHWDIPTWVPGVGGKKFGFDFAKIKEIKLAKGGVINRPTQAIIGESGAEAVIPLQNNLQWLDKLAELLDERIDADNDGGTQTVIVNLDGRTLLRSVNKAQKNKTLVLNGG